MDKAFENTKESGSEKTTSKWLDALRQSAKQHIHVEQNLDAVFEEIVLI